MNEEELSVSIVAEGRTSIVARRIVQKLVEGLRGSDIATEHGFEVFEKMLDFGPDMENDIQAVIESATGLELQGRPLNSKDFHYYGRKTRARSRA